MIRRLDDPFFPITPLLAEGHLDCGDGHQIYWREGGDRTGVPIVLVHGGPGGSSNDIGKRFLDGSKWRIIQFDQRGTGRSTPAGRLEDNSLQHTIADMEAIRRHFGIEQWVVSGGSWGSTVAIAYAEAHPEACLALSLVCTWLCRPEDTQWWFHGVQTIFPELWEQFAAPIPETERGNLRAAYCQRILGPDPAIAAEFAARLFLYEEGFMRFDAPLVAPDPARGVAYGRIFAHYALNDFFVKPNQLIADAHKIAHLPTIMLCGRYDCCTPPNNSYALAQVLPRAILRIVPNAGHYPTETALSVACARRSEDLLDILRRDGSIPAGAST